MDTPRNVLFIDGAENVNQLLPVKLSSYDEVAAMKRTGVGWQQPNSQLA